MDHVINISHLLSDFHVSQKPSSCKSWWMGWQNLPDCVGIIWAKCLETIKQQFSERFTCRKSQEHKGHFQFPALSLFSQFGRTGSCQVNWGAIKCNLSSCTCDAPRERPWSRNQRAGPWSDQSGGFSSWTTKAKAAGIGICQIFSLRSWIGWFGHDLTSNSFGFSSSYKTIEGSSP